MGYQESIVHIKKKHQNGFLKELSRFYTNEYEWNSLAYPDFVIEMKQTMPIDDDNKYKVRKGEKLLFITGERSHQKTLKGFLADKYKKSKVIRKLFFSYKILPIEVCEDFFEGIVMQDMTDLSGLIKRENKYMIITRFDYYKKQLQKERMKNFSLCFSER